MIKNLRWGVPFLFVAIIGFTLVGTLFAQESCGLIFDTENDESIIEDCENPFEAHTDFPFTFIFAGVVVPEGASYEIPLDQTYDVLLSETGDADADSVSLYRQDGQNFYEVELEETEFPLQYETFLAQSGTYKLVINYDIELVTQRGDTWFSRLFGSIAHAAVYENSETFVRTFTITQPEVEAECGLFVYPDYSELVEDCDHPFGTESRNENLVVHFGEYDVLEGVENGILGLTAEFDVSGIGEDVNTIFFTLFRHDGEDFVWERSNLGEHTFASPGTYTMIVEEQDLVVSMNYLQQFRSLLIPTAHAALFDKTIVTFEVVAPEEEPEPLSDLLLQYEPVLYFHPDENYFPMNVEAFVQESGLWDSTFIDENILPRGSEELTLDYLASGADTSNWYLAYSSNQAGTIDLEEASTTYNKSVENGDAVPTYYAYQMEDSFVDEFGVVREYIVLQYWYFYAMNNWEEQGGFNNHEGDWESVFIFLDKETEEPKFAAFSAHHNDGDDFLNPLQYDSVRRSWNSGNAQFENNNIISFVAAGSHANYFKESNHPIPTPVGQKIDKTSSIGTKYYFGDWIKKKLLSINQDDWEVNYSGLWGTDKVGVGTSAPQGPVQSNVSGIVRFDEPIQWAGIDKIASFTVDDPIETVVFTRAQVTMTFSEALAQGVIVTVDPHEETINFGINVYDINFMPRFYDFNTSMLNGNFDVQVVLTYTDEELEALGLAEEDLTVYYHNLQTDTWETVETTVDTVANTASFITDHFSTYALGTSVIEEELTIVELYDALRGVITDSALSKKKKKWLLLQVSVSERLSNKSHNKFKKASVVLLKNIDRKVTQYNRKGLLSDSEKEKIEMYLDEIIETIKN